MPVKQLPPQEYLLQRLSYDLEDGKLYWLKSDKKPKSWNTRYAGKEAFKTKDKDGYWVGAIDGCMFFAHRVVWKMINGTDPDQIDHVNGEKCDNRIANLRNVSNKQNARNRKKRADNQSGATGVSWFNKTEKWRTFIVADGRQKSLGYYEDFSDAVAAREAYKKKHGYTPRHGT